MRTALTIAALALFACLPAHAQADCYARYEHLFEVSQQARFNAPDPQKHQLAVVQHSLLVVLDYLGSDPASVSSTVCGDTLRRVEAQAMVWHERGWTPTAEERAADERAAALKSVNDALAALEGK